MKLVILAGGLGTRISEETKVLPKPMVKIGNKPIIWHLMKIYSHFGIKHFIICLGYKGQILHNKIKRYEKKENWKIDFVETGKNTMTGGRLKKVKKYLKNDKNFCLSYGDGLCNVNIDKLIKFHKKKNKIATLTAVKQNNRFGVLSIVNGFLIKKIKEKPVEFINGGFFVLSNKIFRYLKNNQTIFEKDCLPILSKKKQLMAFRHDGFWGCMDTLRDKNELNKIWNSKSKAWKVWL
jgi:glucose-1-phosphate cytidylyltransferase